MFKKAAKKTPKNEKKLTERIHKKGIKSFLILSLNLRLWGSYFILILFFWFILNASYQNTNHLTGEINAIGTTEVPQIELAGNIKEEVTRIRLYTTKHVYEQNQEDKQKIEDLANDDIALVRENIKKLKKLSDAKEQKLLAEFSDKFEGYAATIPFLFKDSATNNYDIVQPQLRAMEPYGEKTVTSLNTLSRGIKSSDKMLIAKSKSDAESFNYKILLLSVAASLFSILVAFIMTRLIRRAVAGAIKNVDASANAVGKIKKSIDNTALSAQELDSSMNKANEAIYELVASIQQVAGNTNSTASGVEEISAAIEQMGASINMVAGSADQLSSSAEETSSAIQEMMVSLEQVAGNVSNTGASVEQISAAIEEMSKSIKGVSENAVELTHTADQTSATVEEMLASIKQVADSAQTVNQLSHSVKSDALEGTNSLNETLNGMKEISSVINQASDVMAELGKNSKEIGTIIKVIDEIAEQTNLLALNAAIEAARAGDHGKGFAVVADEVRKLAERSALATKDISARIKGIQAETTAAVESIKMGADKVKIGNELAEKTNLAIMKITDGIAQVTKEMNQIAIATEEQTKNSEFITLAFKNVTKQAGEMTFSTKEQSLTAEEIVRGIMSAKQQVHQISLAAAEQAKGGSAIVKAVENVTNQSVSVTNATKEQALTSEEIIRNVNSIKEMIGQITAATNDQAGFGQEITKEVENVKKQADGLNISIGVQTKEVGELVKSAQSVKMLVGKLK